jgi:hypothetical protein
MRSAGAMVWLLVFGVSALGNAQGTSVSGPATGRTALTIYNQDFAVIRTPVELNLQAGTTDVSATNVTAQLEPDSVVLRDVASKRPIRILEQNYDGSLRVQAQMLAKFEGKTIDFSIGMSDGTAKLVQGKIIRAGYVPQYDLLERYGQQYFYQMSQAQQQQEPLIEVEGKLRYGLPGTPIFPADTPGLTLRPTLHWLIASEKPAKFDAELDYITRGLRWDATYNVIAPAQDAPGGQRLDMSGWVNVTNESGTDFHDASLQLMAGDISKLVNNSNGLLYASSGAAQSIMVNGAPGEQQQITQKSFDDYHLYDLHRTATLLDHQSKQIEFLNVAGIPAERVYVYDGFKVDRQNGQMIYYQWNQENFGNGTNKKVWIMQEFKNSEANHLGMPLPKGRMRFYRRDVDGSLQFVGENTIDHTPKDETVKVYLGNAFDITGERTRTDFKIQQQVRTIVESYKVVVKNAKDSAAPVRVVEHLYRTANWEISKNADPFTKADSQTIEFNVEVPAHGEKELTYTVTYTW